MLTGDNERTAEKVAAELKIDSVYAELMPEDKVQLLEEFCNDRMENEKLAFVGDGMMTRLFWRLQTSARDGRSRRGCRA